MEPRNDTDLLETLARKNAVLRGINRIFHEALTTPSEEALGQLCLAVAEEVTGASIGFMGELNERADWLNDLAISDRARAIFLADGSTWHLNILPRGFAVRGIFGRVLREDRSLIANDVATHADRVGTPAGHPVVRNFMGVPLHRNGVVMGMIGLGNRPDGFRDVDRQAVEELAPAIAQALLSKRAETALRESEEARRVSMQLVPAILWRTDAHSGNVVSNGQWEALTGQTAAMIERGEWPDALHPDDAGRSVDTLRAASATGQPVELQVRVRRHDGCYRWYLVRKVPVRDDQGAITHWFGAATDIHDLRLLEERQRVLVAELQHRVRNVLTVVRSVFGRTVETGGTLEDIADHFRGRLDSLARTQVTVTQSASGEVDLENLIRDELLSVGVGDGPSLTIGGPDVALASVTAESLGLAIHELAINAVKYGALKVPSASLDIRWTLDLDYRGGKRLHLIWAEQGVPAVPITPSRQGFGVELIEEALPYRLGAETSLAFVGGGIRCTINLPLRDEGKEH